MKRATSYGSTLLLVNSQNRILWASTGAEDVCGWYSDELIGKPLLFLIPERDREAHTKAFQLVVAGDHPTEAFRSTAVAALGPQGKEFPVNLTLYPFAGAGLFLGLLETR